MEKLLEYLRAQYSAEGMHVVSMEGRLEEIFGEFKLPDEYTVRKLPMAPWNDPANMEKFSEINLKNQTFKGPVDNNHSVHPAWLVVSGSSIESMVDEFLNREFNMYTVLSSIAYDRSMRYLEWAGRVTSMLAKVNMDEALTSRPQTVAEHLAKSTVRLLGMKTSRVIVEAKPFRDDMLVVLKVPVRPDSNAPISIGSMTSEKAIILCRWADKFDQFADQLEKIFDELEEKMGRLLSFRELAGGVDEPHPLIKYLDREMMRPYNTALHAALFYRSRDLADYLRMVVYSNFK